MAPTEGRFAMPERRWDCRHGIPEHLDNATNHLATLSVT